MTNTNSNMDLLENTTFSEFILDKPADAAGGDPPPTPKNNEGTDGNAGAAGTNNDGAGGDGGDGDEAAKAAAEAKAAEEAAALEAEKAAGKAGKVDENGNPIDGDGDGDGKGKNTTDGDGNEGGTGDDPQIIDLIQENLGYEVDGTFENSVEGVTDYARKAIPKAAEQMVQQLFEEYPEAQELINHLSQGNSLETFMEGSKVPEHISQEMTEESVDLQRQIMTDQFISTGMSKEDAEVFVNNLEEQGKLFGTAKSAHDKLKKTYEGQIEAAKQAEIAAQETQQQQATEQWESIKTMVDKGDLGGVTIPQSKQGAFWDYLAKPTNAKNQTARDLKNAELTLEQRMMIEYMIFSDFKVGSKKAAQDLNALHKSNSSRENRLRGTAGKQDQPVNKDTNLDGVSLGNLLPQQ